MSIIYAVNNQPHASSYRGKLDLIVLFWQLGKDQ